MGSMKQASRCSHHHRDKRGDAGHLAELEIGWLFLGVDLETSSVSMETNQKGDNMLAIRSNRVLWRPRALTTAALLGIAIALCVNVQTAYAQIGGGSTTNGCMEDVYNEYGNANGLGCNTNDIQVASVTDINIVDDGCAYVGDTVTFDFTAQIVLTAQARHDIGIYFAIDGDPNGDGALTGTCSISTPPYSGTFTRPDSSTGNFVDLDGTGDDTKNSDSFGYCTDGVGAFESDPAGFPQVCNEDSDCSAGFTCEEHGSGITTPIQDICGDIDDPNGGVTADGLWVEIQTITAVCVDDDGDGNLDLPNCMSWRQPGANDLCLSPLAAFPGSPSKCNCDPGFDVPINVPPELEILKSVLGSDQVQTGAQVTFRISVTNNGPSVAENVVISDELDSRLTFISSAPVPPSTATCSAVGQSVTCALGDMAAGEEIGVDITVQIADDAGEVTIDNTACVEADNVPNVPGDPSDDICDSASVTTPVVIGFVDVQQGANGLEIAWSTVRETANAGFNVYVDEAGEITRINAALIPSSVVSSEDRTDYRTVFEGIVATSIYLEDMDVMGRAHLHGPFEVGRTYGLQEERVLTDWAAIRSEHTEGQTARAATRAAAVTQELQTLAVTAAHVVTDGEFRGQTAFSIGDEMLFLPAVPKQGLTGAGPKSEIAEAGTVVANFHVSQTGLYRVYYEDLENAGYDLAGVQSAQLALTNQGNSVPIFVYSQPLFGDGAYFEFYGTSITDSLYTETDVYTLHVDGALAERVGSDNRSVGNTNKAPTFYMATSTVNHNRDYAETAPGDDPWYDIQLFAWENPVDAQRTFEIDHLVSGAGPVTFSAEFWGRSAVVADPDHHLQVSINDEAVADVTADGFELVTIDQQLDDDTLVSGTNTLHMRLPHDTDAPWDIVDLDRFSLTYPRAFQAVADTLEFAAQGSVFTVHGLSSGDAVAYRLDATPVRLENMVVTAEGSEFSASFRGDKHAEAAYVVTAEAALLKPQIVPAPVADGLVDGTADLLVIAHPSFVAGLQPLLDARTAQGYSIRVATIDEVYANYSYGVVDAQAIRDFIADAAAQMGIQYVMLVGGDTYDYLDYLGNGAMSFVPSLYARTGPVVGFAPVDPLYTDLDDDGVPDLPIGRLPVRTQAELATTVAKILAYDTKDYGQTAVFAAGRGDEPSFTADSHVFTRQLPVGWQVVEAYREETDLTTARDLLMGAINDGAALTSYVGHSSPTRWDTNLFGTADAGSLTNAGEPTVVTQWGCWNTWYVSAKYETLGNSLMLSGDRGGAAVLGATTLTYASSERAFGRLLFPRLVEPGTTIGQAMQDAKEELVAKGRNLPDVILGWTLLGDPTAVIAE